MRVLLEHTKSNHGIRFLQEAKLHTPWFLAFRCLTLRDKELARNNDKLGVVKSAETTRIIIPPNSRITIQGYVDKQLPYQNSCAMLQRTKLSAIPEDLDIVPTVITYKYRQQDTVPVHICNITTRTVAVPPRATLCELLAVNIEELPSKVGTTDPRLDLIHIDTGDVTSNEYYAIRKFLYQTQHLFSWSELI